MPSTLRSDNPVLQGGGEMGALMRSVDWVKTPVGPPETWPQSLKTSISILLAQRTPVFIFWGPEHVQFYNDAYRPILGTTKHPAAMGQCGRDCWPEIWDIIEPMLAAVHRGESTAVEDGLLLINRTGYLEEGYYNYTYSPIRDESGAVGGVFCVVYDTTARVVGERRLMTLRDLAMRSTSTKSAEGACLAAAETLAANPYDVPFASLYLYDEARLQANLVATAGIEAGLPASPHVLRLDSGEPSILESAALNPRLQSIPDLSRRLGPLPKGAWRMEPAEGLVLPISVPGRSLPAGLIVTGINPHKEMDAGYRTFFNLVAGQIGSAVAEVRAYEEERRRAEALAELDRSKTAFFSNVSHEFRTPLTLMLGPIEEMLQAPDTSEGAREELELIHRNSLRLLKLVNTLLDFARIEAGRVEARYQPTDLATFTADLASSFRSAIESAGLRLVIDCPPLAAPVFVDREMWEKIVLNLVSNAFKFTFEGEIAVSLQPAGERVELSVRDTGIGIREADLPKLFERFQRIEGARGRTLEGSGIGLALIRELAKEHGGSVRVESEFGKGSVFTVAVPAGSAHLAPERIRAAASRTATSGARPYVEEALRWMADLPDGPDATMPAPAGTDSKSARRARILIADDNADMRAYLKRLLSDRYDVEAAGDGEAALAAARRSLPDLVLADVMMPCRDGFGLIEALRADRATATVPVILLSARAGEEARIDGLRAGADDYLVKPFSARELLVRVSSRLEIAEIRSGAARREKDLRVIAEAQRQRFHKLLQEAPAMIAVLSGPEHVFQLVNQGYVRAVGRPSQNSLLGKTLREALPELAGQEYPALLDHVYRTGESYFGHEHLTKVGLSGDGSLEERYFDFVYQALKDPNGNVDGILVHAVDVSDRVLSRRKLEESESRFRQLADSLPQIVWTSDSQGFCDYFNHRWREFVGLVWADQQEVGWDQVLHPEDREAWHENWRNAARSGSQFQMECRLFDQRVGAYRWYLARAIPAVEGAAGNVRWYGTCTDVQEQKESEETIRQRQRLESAGLLAGGVAHDFNNILTGVLGNASLLLEDGMVPRSSISMVRDIVNSAERAAHLTRQMLAYAGKGSFVFQEVDLSSQIREMTRLLQAAAPKKVKLSLSLAGDLPLIKADAAQIRQIVMDLAVNSAEAFPPDRSGSVEISTRRETIGAGCAGCFVPAPPAAGAYVVLEVRDDGNGMAPEVLSKVFDPFFSTKFMGRGLGLSAVLGIVRSHKGAVQAESTLGFGTTFRVFLPALTAVRVQPVRAVSVPSRGRTTVLVIDDEEIVRRTIRHALESHGYCVLEARDGREGLEQFKANLEECGLILLDLKMPVMDGEEALRHLRTIDPEIPIILSSGYEEQEATRRFPGCRLSGFVQKPFTTALLIAAVDKVLKSSAGESRTSHAGC